jgi:MFS family permease
LALIIGAFTLIGIAIGNYLFWTPSVLMRSFGWSAPRAGLFLGGVMFVVGTLGVYAGGWLADYMARRGRGDAILRAALLGVACGLPFVIAAPLIEDDRFALPAFAVAIFCLALPQGLPAAALQVMTPNALRARITSIYFFIGNLIANGLGPVLSGVLTDYVFENPADLRYALAIVCGCALPAGLAMLYAGLAPFRACLERIDRG